MASMFSGSSGGDRRPPPARPFSGSTGSNRAPAIRPFSTTRRQTVAPFSAIEPTAAPGEAPVEPSRAEAAAPPDPGPADAAFAWTGDSGHVEVPRAAGEGRPYDDPSGEGSESALRVDDLYGASLPLDLDGVAEPDSATDRDAFLEAPGAGDAEPADQDVVGHLPEPASLAPEWAPWGPAAAGITDGGPDVAEPTADVADSGRPAEPEAVFHVAPEAAWDLPDEPAELLEAAPSEDAASSAGVPDESWFPESPATSEGPAVGGPDYPMEPDLSGYLATRGPEPGAGAVGATHAAELLEAVARMVRSGEIVVSATPGASAESVLASILASLLSPPS